MLLSKQYQLIYSTAPDHSTTSYQPGTNLPEQDEIKPQTRSGYSLVSLFKQLSTTSSEVL